MIDLKMYISLTVFYNITIHFNLKPRKYYLYNTHTHIFGDHMYTKQIVNTKTLIQIIKLKH